VRALSGFTFHKLDISESASVEKSPAFNAVINLAARAGVRASVEDQVKILSIRMPMRYGDVR
jgi:nucleoside-diphosphate-sugar epimerase